METNNETYLSVSTIKIKPGKAKQVQAALTEVAEATLQNEPGAQIYHFFKSEGKDEFVCMEKFASRDAYKIHTSSDHVRQWAEKYLFNPEADLFDGMFEFHNLTKEEGMPAGGFVRSQIVVSLTMSCIVHGLRIASLLLNAV